MEPVNPTISRNLPPTVITIFGITGNLSQIKLLPALYHLLKRGLLPDDLTIIGTFRPTSIDLDKLMQQVEIHLLRLHNEADKAALQKLKAMIKPIVMDSTSHEDYTRLRELLDEIDQTTAKHIQRLFYLAIPPDIFEQVISCIESVGLNTEKDSVAVRMLVEKPFGTNLASAQELIKTLANRFDESQIYRIDHYLAKENAQNILTFRFNNPFIKDIWAKQFIDHIQITANESIGIDSRGNFYEGMGALRDIVQSHLLQLMALVLMEAPATMDSQSIHDQKITLLDAVQVINPEQAKNYAVRGQYEGYRQEADSPDSKIETFAALCLEISNSRWSGVPVLLRTGKALKEQRTEINVVFKDADHPNVPANILTIRIQPNEGISMLLTAKKPGFSNELQPVNMQFTYQDSFEHDSPDAYERVLVDAIAGDQSLFASSQEVLRCWEILEPILSAWQSSSDRPELYPKGSTGPRCADDLAANFGARWI